jgi:NADPH-dependent glutamate synthase beta subunit-like oxidoreductase/Pyruvate/2-oxoacid:ferredoxin oxidoreductase delta subunit
VSADLGSARPLGWSEPGRTTLEIKTGGWRTRRPAYVEATAPCRAACPAGEPIARWIERARLGDHAGAWALIREENPFPAITGRVCAHPCESACNRGQYDGAIAINGLERFIGDWGLEHGATARFPITRAECVAVVGGGPAGLACTYHLSRLGYRVHLFEAERELGGLMRFGIPEYRLPRAVLTREVELAIAPEVEVFTGRRLGEDLSWSTLAAYDAAFLATGATLPMSLHVPGEEARGTGHGLTFLREVNASAVTSLGRKLVVIGGGSTAMDVARSARRLGVPSVTVLALEARDDMPAQPVEVGEALTEGVEIVNGVGVCSFLEASGGVSGVVARPAQLGRDDAGAVRAIFGPGSSLTVDADSVLVAVGQRADLSRLPAGVRCDSGLIAVNGNGATSARHVFAGGDAASHQRTVTHAIGAGTRAARSIHAALSGSTGAADPAPGAWALPAPEHLVGFSEINVHYFPRVRRASRRQRPPDRRLRSFVETAGGFDAETAAAEMARCFTCGHCVGCDNCFIFCPDMAVSRVDGRYRISADHCKGCGLCVEECPRGSLRMASER